MYNPISTYRLQFHKQFTFKDADKLTTYFKKLGAGTIYASPVFEAVPGSVHGYDGLNPKNVNPELGTRQELECLCRKLKENGTGWLQDIVPNHLAYDTRNPWLFDVLEKGKNSPFSGYFDIRWSSGEPLVAPFLGTDLKTAIHDGTITVIFEKGRFFFRVYDQKFPVTPASYTKIFRAAGPPVPDKIRGLISEIPPLTANKTDNAAWGDFVSRLFLATGEKEMNHYIHSCLEKVNASERSLNELLNEQTYHLCHWKHTHEKINYRRFFTVNGLICLNMHKANVFDSFHGELMKMVHQDIFQGLRIDHIDGLYNPGEYLERLRKKTGPETYIVVEKILEPNEVIPGEWPVQGTTGYDFLATVNNLFTHTESKQPFTDFYTKISRNKASLRAQIKEKKALILYRRMAGELDNLFFDLKRALGADDQIVSDIEPEKMKKAIGAFLIECPVYRFYGRQMPLPQKEKKAIKEILDKIILTSPELKDATGMLKLALLEKSGKGNKNFDRQILHFYHRFMQMSGPLMAKGVEDTLMYSYNRFIGHNEVGDSPGIFGIDAAEWHSRMLYRMKHHPLTMNASSTHDTKRGEDVRARLNVLTDIPGMWFEKVTQFQKMNRRLKSRHAPDMNDEYFIYFTLLGMYPMPGGSDEDVPDRLKEYFPKALREAKEHSSWNTSNENYEEAVTKFALALLNKEKPFWEAFRSLHRTTADFGIVNSLAQLTLKMMSPGVPDIYQGTELWDLNLVDPDNRRPVDYALRIRWLDETAQIEKENPEKLPGALWEERANGKIKLWLTQKLLQYRKNNPGLFLKGGYIPIQMEGKYKNSVLAFIRKHNKKMLLVAVPLHLATLCRGNENKIPDFDWEDTSMILPGKYPIEWKNILTNTKIAGNKRIAINAVSGKIPVWILEN